MDRPWLNSNQATDEQADWRSLHRPERPDPSEYEDPQYLCDYCDRWYVALEDGKCPVCGVEPDEEV